MQISSIVETADKIKELAHRHKIPMERVIADEDWVWGWVIDLLQCNGFINNSRPIQIGLSKYNEWYKRNYQNLKTQCYFWLREIINNNKIRVNDEVIKETLTRELDIICQIDLDKDWPIKVLPKQDQKELLGNSPDFADALMMRYYFDLKDIQAHESTTMTWDYQVNPYDIKIDTSDPDNFFAWLWKQMWDEEGNGEELSPY